MTDKVNLKVDVVTPLKETFEQKSKKKSSWSSTTSDDNYPSEKLVKDSLDDKVDKVSGKGLSSEDYTSEEKTKLNGIENGANKTTVDSSLSSSSTNPVQNKVIQGALDNKADSSSVPTKTSDLTNDGEDGTNEFVSTDDSRLSDSRTPKSHTHGNISNSGTLIDDFLKDEKAAPLIYSNNAITRGTIDTIYLYESPTSALPNIGVSINGEWHNSVTKKIDTALGNKADASSLSNYVLTSKIITDIDSAVDNTEIVGALEMLEVVEDLRRSTPSGAEVTANKVSSWSSTPNDTHYPTEKLTKDSLDAKLDDSQLKTSVSSTSSNTDIPSAKAVYDYVNSVPKWSTYVATSLNDLPATGQVGVFYLVPNSSGEQRNTYDEYFWNESSSSYEKFGSKTIDISNLVTMDDVLEYINNNGQLSLPTSGDDAGYLVFTVS